MSDDKLAEVDSEEDQLLSRQSFLEGIGTLNPRTTLPSTWSETEKKTGTRELLAKPLGTGLYDKIPRMCDGAGKMNEAETDWDTEPCPEYKRCQLGKKPVGHQCPVEATLVDALLLKYSEYLVLAENDVGTFSLMRDLVDVEIQQIRKQGQLADMSNFLVKQDQYSTDGDYLTTILVENPLVSIDDRLARRKQTILKQLAVTREQQLRYLGDQANREEISRVASVMEKISQAINKDGEVDKYGEDEEIIDSFIDVDPEEVIEVEVEVVEDEE